MRIHVPVCLIYLDFLWHQIPQPIRHHSLVEPDIFFPAAISGLEGITVSAGQGKVSKPWAPVHHHNMSKNFTLHFYLCIILPSNIIISHSCVISIRNQNDIRISCRVLPLSARMEAPYKAMCSTRKPFRTPLKLAETRKPLHQDFYFYLWVKMPSDRVCS